MGMKGNTICTIKNKSCYNASYSSAGIGKYVVKGNVNGFNGYLCMKVKDFWMIFAARLLKVTEFWLEMLEFIYI